MESEQYKAATNQPISGLGVTPNSAEKPLVGIRAQDHSRWGILCGEPVWAVALQGQACLGSGYGGLHVKGVKVGNRADWARLGGACVPEEELGLGVWGTLICASSLPGPHEWKPQGRKRRRRNSSSFCGCSPPARCPGPHVDNAVPTPSWCHRLASHSSRPHCRARPLSGWVGRRGKKGVSAGASHTSPPTQAYSGCPPPNPLPRSCVLGLLVTSPQGFQTREAARCSALASPGSRSSGTSAWNRLPMLMCLREQQGQAGSRGYPQGGGTPRDPTVPKYTQACRVSQDLPTQHSPLGHELRMQYFLGLHLGYSGMQGGWVIPQPGQQRLL